MKIRTTIFDQKSTEELFKAAQLPKRKKEYEKDQFSFLDKTNTVDINIDFTAGIPAINKYTISDVGFI